MCVRVLVAGFPGALVDATAAAKPLHLTQLHMLKNTPNRRPLLARRRFAYHPGPVMTQYQVEIGRRSAHFDGQSLTTTMWAMAALSVSAGDILVA